MMATTMLIVQLLMDEDSSEEEEIVSVGTKRGRPAVRASTSEDNIRSVIPVAIQTVNCLMASGCLHEGSWWVRERSLIWFDYFLMKAFEDFRWRSCVAVPRDMFLWMVSVLTPRLSRQETHWRKPVPADVKLGACLHRLVTGSSYFLCSDRFGIGASTLQEQMPLVVEAIVEELGPRFLYWAEGAEGARVSPSFLRRCGLLNVAGAIDGSHIKIRYPKRLHARDYFNRKRDQSIVLQAICDHDSEFLDISCDAPGSSTRPYLLGDQGYAMHSWLMIPFSINNRSSAEHQLYNKKHVQGRLCIERAFGLLKARFRILEHGITSSLEWAAKLVHATCVLHNIIVKKRLGHDDVAAVLEPTLRREQAARTRRRRLQGRPDYADSGHEVREELVNYVAARNM
ncbi:hypothetical protein R1sor_003246 [Riccia sorocarpa]|uniref:DDE Tnp4 domain-containing protein n=1 Tax=Riccia sorocarpa TaxID=122646 RepID=A0ABD3H4Y0_9MARC